MNLNFFRDVKKMNGIAYIVGGYVRDKLLGIINKDIDIEVFGLSEEALEQILKKYGNFKKVGAFEIYLLNNSVEISLNNKIWSESTNEEVLQESAKRRDLSINAIYFDPISGEIYDPMKGTKDIKDRLLRYCDDSTFMDDPVRILRVAYFYEKYGFEVKEELKELIKLNSEKILEVVEERIVTEFEKILSLKNPSKAFLFLKEMGVLEKIIGVNNNLEKFEKIKTKDKLVLWGILYKGGNSFPYYFMKDKKLIGELKSILDNYEILRSLEKKFDIYLIKKIAINTPIRALLKIYYYIEEEKLEFIKKVFRNYLKIRKDLEPIILGRDLLELGFQNRRDFGKILEEIYEEQLKDRFDRKERAVEYIKKTYKEFTKPR